MTLHLALVLYSDRALPVPATLDRQLSVRAVVPPVRPGQDTVLFGATEEVTRRIGAAEHAVLLAATGASTDGDLTALQARLADAVELLGAAAVTFGDDGLPSVPRIDVVDLYCMDGRPLAEAVRRLRSTDVQALLWVAARPRADGCFDLETFGLRKLGLPELCVPGVERRYLDLVSRFVNRAARYACLTGATMRAGDRVAFGWVDVRLLAAESLAAYPDVAALCAPRYLRELADAPLPGVLVVAEPESDDADAPLCVGARRAARIVETMVGAARQCGLEQGVEVPRALQTAVICRLALAGPPLQARRLKPDEPESSGWVAVCDGPEHDHDDPASFEVRPLWQLAAAAPRVFSMLAAPPGTGLVVQPNGELSVLLPE